MQVRPLRALPVCLVASALIGASSPSHVWAQSFVDVDKVRFAGTSSAAQAAADLLNECRAKYPAVADIVASYSVQLTITVAAADVVFGGQPFGATGSGKPYYLDIEAVQRLPRFEDLGHGNTPSWATTQCMVVAHEVEENLTHDHLGGVERENEIRTLHGMLLRDGAGQMSHGDHQDALVPIGPHLERFHRAPTTGSVTFSSVLPSAGCLLTRNCC